MKREIKFRAWDNVNGVMELNVHHLDSLNEILHKDKYDVMQFTGLKDKNGKEIYEGDIVQHNGNNYIIKTSENWGVIGLATIKENEGFNGVLMIHHRSRDYQWFYNTKKYIEVIGNVYENPTL